MMKTKAKLLALVLLALPVGAQAQEHLQKLFEKIANTKGIEVSTSQNIVRDDEDGNRINDLMEATTIYDIRVGRPNFDIFKELEKAFQTGNTMPTTIYTCFNPMEGSLRQLWNIQTKKGDDIRIGQHEGSSYALVVYSDENNSRFRTVYAAEWWDTDDPNIRQGRLVRSYGEKPQTTRIHVLHDSSSFGDIDSLLTDLPMRERFDFSGKNIEDIMNQARQLKQNFRWRADTVPADIPFSGSVESWMSKALNNIKHLSNSDWHRFFGLLTQKMIDRSNKERIEDLVVAAGIILDLCKNVGQLDADEREISARRLEDVSEHYFTGDKTQYIYDLLMLAAKKLVKDN